MPGEVVDIELGELWPKWKVGKKVILTCLHLTLLSNICSVFFKTTKVDKIWFSQQIQFLEKSLKIKMQNISLSVRIVVQLLNIWIISDSDATELGLGTFSCLRWWEVCSCDKTGEGVGHLYILPWLGREMLESIIDSKYLFLDTMSSPPTHLSCGYSIIFM